jgi:hypothetical protein
MCIKAINDWDGAMQIWGSEEFKQRLWLEAQRQGVRVSNYAPPEHVRRQWEQEQAQQQRRAGIEAVITDQAALARRISKYAAGDVRRLGDPQIRAYIDGLDDAERARVAGLQPYEAIPLLAGWRNKGAERLKEAALAASARGSDTTAHPLVETRTVLPPPPPGGCR